MDASLRFNCMLTEFSDCWVEVSNVWTRSEMRALYETGDPEVLVQMLQTKLAACHIRLLDGSVIDVPAHITPDLFDSQIDLRLTDFLGSVLVQALAELRKLGPMSGRLSSASPAVKT